MVLRTSVLLVAFVLFTTGALGASAGLVHVFATRHFTIYGIPGDDVRGEYVGDRAEEWFTKLSGQVGLPQTGWSKVPIMVYPSHQAFVGSTGDEFGEKMVGRAYPGDLRIELDASEMFAPMESIIGHELTHVMIFRILGSRSYELPLWANEGIAKVESGEWDELDSRAIADAAASGEVPTLEDLESGFPRGQAAISYAVSASMVNYLQIHSPHGFVKPVLARVAAGQSFDDAVRSVTRKPLDEWEKAWRKETIVNYAPYGWVRAIGVVSAAVLPILAVLAFLAIRRKKRIAAEQYAWDDGYDPAVDREYWPRSD